MVIKSEKLELKDFPKFGCPTCKKGTLKIQEETIVKKYPSWIENLPDNPHKTWNSDGKVSLSDSKFFVQEEGREEFIVSFFLKCDKEHCAEVFTSCGKIKIEMETIKDEAGVYDCYHELYYPQFFYPKISLFEIPLNTPIKIQDELHTAFSLFWSSPSSCANSIRKTVEIIINQISESNTGSLHQKIQNLNDKYSPIKGYLLAIKWIGNDGSHSSELNHSDAILAFKFIDKCLHEIYDDKNSDLDILATEINNHKKPISKINTDLE